MSNLIDQSLKIASYGVGAIDIFSGNTSRGLLLINSQRQISQLTQIDEEIKTGNAVMYQGFEALEDHLEQLNHTNETGFNELTQSLRAVEQGIVQMGNEVVAAIYTQTIEQRAFQKQVIQNNELVRDILDRVLVETEKQTTALENPDQTLSIEKLKTAIKMMKLFDPELNNFQVIEEAIRMSKIAIEKDPFNEEAAFYCAKWMNYLGISGWKEMYFDAMQKTKIELENEDASQANLARQNAIRLSIAASVDIIESLDFKLFGEKFYPFATQHCGESFLMNLEVFYYYYLCSELNEKDANKHLYRCFLKYGKQVFYDEIVKNPLVLGFEIFWSFIMKEEKDRQLIKERESAQRREYGEFQEEQKKEEANLDANKVDAKKRELNQKIYKRIQKIQESANELVFSSFPDHLKFSDEQINCEYRSEAFPSMDVFLSIDNELNIFKWKPSKNKLRSLETTWSGSDELTQLCFDKVNTAAEKLTDIIVDFVGTYFSLIEDYEKLGEIVSTFKENIGCLEAADFTDDLQNIKFERKVLKDTVVTLRNNLDAMCRMNELGIEYADDFNFCSKEKEIKGIIKEVFTYISILNDFYINEDSWGRSELSSDDITRICDQNIQLGDECIGEVFEPFFCALMWLCINWPHFHTDVSLEIFNRNREMAGKLEECDSSTFTDALNKYILSIDRGDIGSLKEIERVSQLFD